MDTFSYMFALGLMLVGGFLLLKCFIGQSSGVMGVIGFFLLMGGIASFNKIGNDSDAEIHNNIPSSVDHSVINEDIYNRDIDIENGNRASFNEEGEGIDFSGVNAEHDRIRAEGDAKRQQMRYEQQKKFNMAQEEMNENEWDEE